MAAINPFYRFELPEANAGFFPECNRISYLLNALEDDFIANVGSYTSVTWAEANALLKNSVAAANSIANANFKISYPNPFPDLIPAGTFAIYIYNEQLRAIDPTMEIVVTVVHNSNIVSFTFSFTGSVLTATTTAGQPFIREERKALIGLSIWESNKDAFFQKPYFFDPLNKWAVTPLARGRSWKNDSTYRHPVNASGPEIMRTAYRPPVTSLSRDARVVMAQMNEVIKAANNGADQSTLISVFNSITWPQDWGGGQYNTASNNLELTINSFTEVIRFLGVDSGTGFKFQRFYCPFSWSGPYFLDIYPSPTLPIEPTFPAFSYLGAFVDYDLAMFPEDCPVQDEVYPMPIKPGDELSFIIPEATSNVIGLTSVNVGLFTEDGVFVQKIGEANTEYDETPCTQFVFVIYPLSQFLANPLNIGFGIGPPPSTTIINTLFQFDLGYGGNYPGTTDQFMDAMVEGFPEADGSIRYIKIGSDEFGDIYQVTWTVNQTFPAGTIASWGIMISPTSMDAVTYNDTEFGQQWGEGEVCISPECEKYLFANVIIPNKPYGCYRFGLYALNPEEGQYDLYSMSNQLRLDWSDCYSTILEFFGKDNSMNQGFYYAPGWRHRIRLGINGGGDKPRIEENLYRQSNGVYKRPSNKLDYAVDLHTDFLDLPTQRALVDATRHDFLIWENRNLFVSGEVEVATTQDFSTQSSFESLAQVKFSALIQGYQPDSSSCLTC